MAGIPTFVVTRSGFSQVVGNAFSGLGFSAEGPTVYEFPMEMFLLASDLTPLNENIDKVVYGLTKWEPEVKETGAFAPPMVTVAGKDYQEAVANMNHLFLKNQWSDGLPLLPATEERVNWILRGTDLPRDALVGEGKFLPKGGITTVESIAVALAMAGGRPEYLPVLIGSVDAFINPKSRHQNLQATTSSGHPAVIVNGPIAKQIRLNSGYGLLGPHALYPAGVGIGRALRLLQLNLGGAIPGIGTMATYGGPCRTTNYVFAEDEAGIPEQGWKSLSEERGFPKGSNVVTVTGVAGASQLQSPKMGTEEAALVSLDFIMLDMWSNYGNMFGDNWGPEGVPGVLLLPRLMVRDLQRSLGWSKEELQTYLWENARIPASHAKGNTLYLNKPSRIEQMEMVPGFSVDEPWPITLSPKNIMILVAGGEQSGHGYWMRTALTGATVSAEIKLPENWEELLKEAEEDLGPAPAA
jgi:hypothetical protein